MLLMLAETAAHVVPPPPPTDPNTIAAQVWAIPSVPLHVALIAAAALAGFWWLAQKLWQGKRGLETVQQDFHNSKAAIGCHIDLLKGAEFDALWREKAQMWVTTDAFKTPVNLLLEHKLGNYEQKFANMVRKEVEEAVAKEFLPIAKDLAKLEKTMEAMQGAFSALMERVNERFDRPPHA